MWERLPGEGDTELGHDRQRSGWSPAHAKAQRPGGTGQCGQCLFSEHRMGCGKQEGKRLRERLGLRGCLSCCGNIRIALESAEGSSVSPGYPDPSLLKGPLSFLTDSHLTPSQVSSVPEPSRTTGQELSLRSTAVSFHAYMCLIIRTVQEFPLWLSG